MSTTTSPPPPLPPQSPSDYMVGVLIGEGAFGNVLYGKHKQSQREVAIKVVLKHSIEKHPSLLTSILQERSILTLCEESPYIITLYASFHDETCLYLVMECATRGTLLEVCAGMNTLLDTQVAAYYTLQLLQALQYLHCTQHVIHADLKPSNILIMESGKLKLSDFGSAIVMNNDTDVDARTTTTMPRGTTDYSAPEVIRNTTTITTAIDLWSLGCVVYSMFCRGCESPFEAASNALVVDKIMTYVKEYDNENTELNIVAWENVPNDDWKKLIQQLLHPDATRRGDAKSIVLEHPALFDTIDTMKEPPYVPSRPSWWNEAQTTPMRDGNQGWVAYVLD